MWCILCVYTICVIGSILLDDDVPLELAIERVRRLRVDDQHDQGDLTTIDALLTDTTNNAQVAEANPTQSKSNNILTKLTSQELVTLDSFGTEYYTNRVYKGLDMITPVDREHDYSVHEGQNGLAAGYQRPG